MIEIPIEYSKVTLDKQSSESRYYFTDAIKDLNDNVLYDLFDPVNLITNTDFVYHVVEETEKDRLDLIAYKYYLDTSYWWVIAMANNIVDPFILTVGTTIKIPNSKNFIIGGTKNG